MTVRRTFWILSIANWLLAVAVWSISAYLGIARPTSLFIPTTLFVIGIFAVIAGTLCWVVARFGQPPETAAAGEVAAETAAAETATAETATAETAAAAPAQAAPTVAAVMQPEAEPVAPAQAAPTAAESGMSAVAEPLTEATPGELGPSAEQPLPAEAG